MFEVSVIVQAHRHAVVTAQCDVQLVVLTQAL